MLEGMNAEDGARVGPEHVVPAITAGGFVYDNGATQVLDTSGATTSQSPARSVSWRPAEPRPWGQERVDMSNTVSVTDSTFGDAVLASEKLTVAKLDVDANPETAAAYGVRSIPTMILFDGGKPVKQIVGAQPKAALLSELSGVL